MPTDTHLRDSVSLAGTFMDWLLLPNGALSEDEEVATAVRLALGTDRRGWWGDLEADEIWGGWPIGCKNWLLLRAKISDQFSWEGGTVIRAQTYTREALQPIIDNRIASQIDVQASRVGKQEIDVHVTIYRGPKTAIELRFQYLWADVTGI